MQANQGKLGKATGLGLLTESQDLESNVNTAPPLWGCLSVCRTHFIFKAIIIKHAKKKKKNQHRPRFVPKGEKTEQ